MKLGTMKAALMIGAAMLLAACSGSDSSSGSGGGGSGGVAVTGNVAGPGGWHPPCCR
jgi:hypothetical protein